MITGAVVGITGTTTGTSLSEAFAGATPLAVYRLPIQEIHAWGPSTPLEDHAGLFYAKMTDGTKLAAYAPHHFWGHMLRKKYVQIRDMKPEVSDGRLVSVSGRIVTVDRSPADMYLRNRLADHRLLQGFEVSFHSSPLEQHNRNRRPADMHLHDQLAIQHLLQGFEVSSLERHNGLCGLETAEKRQLTREVGIWKIPPKATRHFIDGAVVFVDPNSSLVTQQDREMSGEIYEALGHAAFAEEVSVNLPNEGFPYRLERDTADYMEGRASEAKESFMRAARIFEEAGWDVFAGDMHTRLMRFLIAGQLFNCALEVLPDMRRFLEKMSASEPSRRDKEPRTSQFLS